MATITVSLGYGPISGPYTREIAECQECDGKGTFCLACEETQEDCTCLNGFILMECGACEGKGHE